MTELEDFFTTRNFKGLNSDRVYVGLKADIPKRVFLCGGNHSGNFRDKISDELEKHDCTVIRAEKALESYEEQNSDTDLLELETYYAALVAIIPIVCESPGSIAELGAFVSDINIREKVFIIIKEKYYSGNKNGSFICRGLIKNYEKHVSKDKFEICEIDDKRPKKDVKRVANSIIKHQFEQTGCDFRLPYFQILLLADIINALVFSTKKNIKKHFRYALTCAFPNKEIGDADLAYKNFENRLNDMLFILDDLDIITKNNDGKYVSIQKDFWFISYRSIDKNNYKRINEVRSETYNTIIKKNKERSF